MLFSCLSLIKSVGSNFFIITLDITVFFIYNPYMSYMYRMTLRA